MKIVLDFFFSKGKKQALLKVGCKNTDPNHHPKKGIPHRGNGITPHYTHLRVAVPFAGK